MCGVYNAHEVEVLAGKYKILLQQYNELLRWVDELYQRKAQQIVMLNLEDAAREHGEKDEQDPFIQFDIQLRP